MTTINKASIPPDLKILSNPINDVTEKLGRLSVSDRCDIIHNDFDSVDRRNQSPNISTSVIDHNDDSHGPDKTDEKDRVEGNRDQGDDKKVEDDDEDDDEEDDEEEDEDDYDYDEEDDEDDDDDDDDNLIERGPMKSQTFSSVRQQPYHTIKEQESSQKCENFFIQEILNDEASKEILFNCLDHLMQNDHCNDNGAEAWNTFETCDSKNEFVSRPGNEISYQNETNDEQVARSSKRPTSYPRVVANECPIVSPMTVFVNDNLTPFNFPHSSGKITESAYRLQSPCSSSPSPSSSDGDAASPYAGYPIMLGQLDQSPKNRSQQDYEEVVCNGYKRTTDNIACDLVSLQLEGKGVKTDETRVDELSSLFGFSPEPLSSIDHAAFDSNLKNLGTVAPNRYGSDRGIVPWPLLNLPSCPATERLKTEVDPKELEKAMRNLLKRSVEELAKQDEDGDTELTRLVGNSDEFFRKKAYLVPLVDRLSTRDGALGIANYCGEDALYLAAMRCPGFPYVTGYLAAKMLDANIDVGQRLYRTRGDTLIHSIATQGDGHKEVLTELLALRTRQGNAVFDLSKRNYDGKTALRVAIESHVSKGIPSLGIVKLLLKHGPNPRTKETKCDDTVLHIAVQTCDPSIVKLLLDHNRAGDLVNEIKHNATDASWKVPFELIHAGIGTNHDEKTPLAIVSTDKKESLKRIINGRS